MIFNMELLLTIAGGIGALSVITVFLGKIIKPLQDINTSVTLMQRERLESAHAIYAHCLGWCPSGEKTVLSDIYRHYVRRGNNHIAGEYIRDICSLPDHPQNPGERDAALIHHG